MKANTILNTTTHAKPLTPAELLALDTIAHDDENPITCEDDWVGAMVKMNGKVIGKTRGKQKAPTKSAVTLRLDPKIIEFFKVDGKGYQTRINQVLLDYVTNHQALSSV